MTTDPILTFIAIFGACIVVVALGAWLWLALERFDKTHNPTPDHAETDAEHDDEWAAEIVRRHCLQARLEENRRTRSYIEAVRDE